MSFQLGRIRFNPWRLLLVAGTIIIVQRARPWVGARVPGLSGILAVAPNLMAGLGLPFAWASRGVVTQREHWRRCGVTLLALLLYELAQGAGVGAGHLHFDFNDILASVAGVAVAATLGWRLMRHPVVDVVNRGAAGGSTRR